MWTSYFLRLSIVDFQSPNKIYVLSLNLIDSLFENQTFPTSEGRHKEYFFSRANLTENIQFTENCRSVIKLVYN